MAKTNERLWIFDKIRSFGDKIFLVHQDYQYSFTEFCDAIDAAQKKLTENNVTKSEVVGILSDYSFNSLAYFFALFQNGNIISPITVTVNEEIEDRLNEGFINKVLRFSSDGVKISDHESAKQTHSIINNLNEKNQSGLILFSSGSTGKPKAMVHNLDNLLNTYRDKRPKSLIMLVLLLFDHIGGLNTLFNAIATGSTVVIPDSRDATEICKLIEKYRVNILPASPTFLNLILMSEADKQFDLSSLRIITYGTEPMSESLLSRIQHKFSKVKLIQTFGTSETGISHTTSKSSASTLIKIDDPNIEYKIVDDELWLRSKTQILGYLNYSMEKFTEDGWFATGDFVEQKTDGYLKIIGRKQEVINVGGQKVLPAEVESVLMEIPEIADCLVLGATNAITGQAVIAQIVLSENANDINISKIVRRYCKNHLDLFKVPTKVKVVEKIEYSTRFKKIRNSEN